MAHEIEYMVYDYDSYWDQSETPPENPNDIYGIVLDDCWYTENVGPNPWTQKGSMDRLRVLTGREEPSLPDGMEPSIAVAYIEAIWLDAIRHNLRGHHRVINSFFIEALKAEIGAPGYERQFDEITYNGKRIDWSVFEEVGEEAGVEHMIDAWLSGVPLEYVIAE